jgi:hypothetical protein
MNRVHANEGGVNLARDSGAPLFPIGRDSAQFKVLHKYDDSRLSLAGDGKYLCSEFVTSEGEGIAPLFANPPAGASTQTRPSAETGGANKAVSSSRPFRLRFHYLFLAASLLPQSSLDQHTGLGKSAFTNFIFAFDKAADHTFWFARSGGEEYSRSMILSRSCASGTHTSCSRAGQLGGAGDLASPASTGS